MKKQIMFLFVLSVVCINVFGKGEKETEITSKIISKGADYQFLKKNTDGKPTGSYKVTVTVNGGKTSVRIPLNNTRKDETFYIILKKDNIYSNPTNNKKLNADAVKGLFTDIPQTAKKSYLENSQVSQLVASEVWTFNSSTVNTGQIAAAEKSKDSSEIVLEWDSYGSTIVFDLLIIKKPSGGAAQCERILFTLLPEFFEGEIQLFRETDNEIDKYNYFHQDKPIEKLTAYAEKAVTVLGLFFAGTELYTFLDMVNRSICPGIDINNMADIIGLMKNTTFKGKSVAWFKDNFKYSLWSHFGIGSCKTDYNGTELDLPYFDFNENDFDAIYGAHRNIYMTTYLFVLYMKNKPLYSYLLENQLKRVRIPYNYREYHTIDLEGVKPVPGKTSENETWGNDLARMALRYLTWGVEYTPYPEKNSIGFSHTTEALFFNAGANTKKWLTDTGTRNLNYRGTSGIKNVTTATLFLPASAPQRMQILRGDFYANYIQLLGRMKLDGLSYKSMALSRIDLWTSNNILWDTEPAAVSISGSSSVFSPEQISRLYNKSISFTDADNLHIPRKDRENIRIKLTFTGQQRIAAVCVVRARAEDTWKDYNYFNPGTGKLEELVCFESDASNFRQISGKPKADLARDANNTIIENGFTEYVTIPKQNIKRKEGGTDAEKLNSMRRNMMIFGDQRRQPGWGMTSGFFMKAANNGNKKQLSYSYLVFNTPLENCKELILIYKYCSLDIEENINGRIVKRTECTPDYLDISEIMIFPDNPVNYGDVREGCYLSYLDGKSIDDAVFGNGDITTPDIKSSGLKTASYGISLKDFEPVKTIVAWEEVQDTVLTHTSFSERYTNQFQVLYGTLALSGEATFSAIDNPDDFLSTLNSIPLQTPFGAETMCGNPLPYAVKGIDSPRTFAYKMYEQYRAREWYKKMIGKRIAADMFTNKATTAGIDGYGIIDYDRGYVDEVEIFGKKSTPETLTIDSRDFCYKESTYTAKGPDGDADGDLGKMIKPFLPGKLAPTKDQYIAGYNSLYSPDKVAGIDSVGLLCGSLSMGEFDRVYNVFNQRMTTLLDGYYRMDKSLTSVNGINLTGLDANGKPSFYTGTGSSFLDTPCRLTIADIEKCTVIVPDISLIEPGDLLVNVQYNTGNDPHIGIVAGFLKPRPSVLGTDTRNYWENVVVVSVRRGLKMATLGTWGSKEGIFGGFATNPGQYQIRRLLVKTDSTPPASSAETDSWELIDPVLSRITCNLTVENDPYTGQQRHWIPNVYEANETFEIASIDITPYNLEGKAISFSDLSKYNNIKLLPPEDMNYNYTEAEGKSNIYTNKGGGLEFYAVRDGLPPFLLATFTPDTITEFMTGKSRYRVTGNSPYINSDGESGTEGRLYVDTAEKLCFSKLKIDGTTEWSTIKFGIRAIAPMRPGDDFLLRFGISGDICTPGVVPEEDFMAVYDKKMLWRANLYVDERPRDMRKKIKNVENKEIDNPDYGKLVDLDGNLLTMSTPKEKYPFVDWNDLNPWVTENDWAESGSLISGGQIEIKPWFMFKWGTDSPFFSIGGDVFDGIPYSFGGIDSPADCNKDMSTQAIAMGTTNNTLPQATTPLLHLPNPTPNPLVPTDNYWYNYSPDSFLPGFSYLIVMDNTDNHYQYFDSNVYNFNPSDIKDREKQRYSAGIDCFNLIRRSCYYKGNNYLVGLNASDTAYDTLFEEKINQGTTLSSWNFEEIQYAVPGDMVWEDGHGVIIGRIIFKNADGDTILNRKANKKYIIYIEATTRDRLLKTRCSYSEQDHNESSRCYGRIQINKRSD